MGVGGTGRAFYFSHRIEVILLKSGRKKAVGHRPLRQGYGHQIRVRARVADSPARLDAPGVAGNLCDKPAPPKEFVVGSVAKESGAPGALVLAATITSTSARPCSAHRGSSPGAGPMVGCSIGVKSVERATYSIGYFDDILHFKHPGHPPYRRVL